MFSQKGDQNVMKKYLLVTVVLFSLLAFISPVWSYTIYGGTTDVGSLDLFLDSSLLTNSGDQTEIDWVNSVLATIFTTDDLTKDDDYSDNPWILVDGESDIYASELQDDPEYFFIKIGNGNLPAGTHDHYLYQNVEEFSYAVVDLSVISSSNSMNVGRFSHTGEVGGVPVPEPATMLLLGSGLIGLAVLGRSRFRKT